MGRDPLDRGQHGNMPTPRLVGPKLYEAKCRYRGFDGRTVQIKRRGTSKTAALGALQAEITKRRGATDLDGVKSHHRVAVAADLWIARVKERRRGTTAETYSRLLERHVRPALGEVRIREVTVPVLDTFLDDLARRGYAASTRRTIKTILRGVMQTAVHHGAIPANPVRDVERIESGKAKAPRALTVEERIDLVTKLHADPKAVAHDIPDFVTFMLATGARIGEAIAVRWCDLGVGRFHTAGGPRVRPIVTISGNVVRITGHEDGLVRHDGKTETAIRAIALPRFAVAMLGARRPSDAPDDLPVFPSGALTYRDARNTSRSLRAARERAGYDWVNCHVFRKTAASEWKRMGLDDREIADLMGHSQISMTQNVYFGRRELVAAGADAWDRSWTAPAVVTPAHRG